MRMECIFLLVQRLKFIVIKQHTRIFTGLLTLGLFWVFEQALFMNCTHPHFPLYLGTSSHVEYTRCMCDVIMQSRGYLSQFRVHKSLILQTMVTQCAKMDSKISGKKRKPSSCVQEGSLDLLQLLSVCSS